MSRIAIVTFREDPAPSPDDSLLLEPLAKAGIDAIAVPWDEPDADWPGFDAAVIRSPWDYFMRPEEFLAWLDARTADGTRLLNPPGLIRWNIDKGYLHDVAARGIPVVPTAWIERGSRASLGGVLAERGWDRAVVKPRISAGAWRTWITTPAESAAHQSHLDEVLGSSDAMVQPFLDAIVDEGEWSLVFFGGEHSHTVVKRAAPGDFRVQERHGGRTEAAEAPPGIMADARAALEVLPEAPLYVRVDGVRDDGRLMVMEIEAFEPALFFRYAPGAAERFVEALRARLAAGSA